MVGIATTIVNFLIEQIGFVLLLVIALLPDSPFSGAGVVPSSIDLGGVVYFIPFPTMFTHLTVLVSAIAIYYCVRVLARWVKVAKG